MSRGKIVAGRTVILIEAQDMIDKTLGKVRTKLHKLSNGLNNVGQGLTRTGFFGAVGSGLLLRNFAKFEDTMLELRVKMGLLGQTTAQQEAQFTGLEALIRKLGKSTTFTSQQVASAATELAKAGFNEAEKEISNTLAAVLDLARAQRIDGAEATVFLSNAMRAFGIETSQAALVASQLTKATRSGTLNIEDLGQALKFASATSSELGESLPLVLAAMAQISNKGLRGSIAGTSFNAALVNLAKKAPMIAESLGVAVATTPQGTLDLVSTLQRLNAATQNMTRMKRTEVFSDLFNLRGMRSFLPTSKDVGTLLELTNSIANAGNEADLAARVMESGLTGATNLTIAAFDDLTITIGNAAKKAIIPFLNAVKELINALNTLAATNPVLSTMIVLSPALLLAAGVGFIGLAKAARVAAYAVGGLIGVFRPLSKFLISGTGGQLIAMSKISSMKMGGTGLGTASRGISETYAGLRGAAVSQNTMVRQKKLVVLLRQRAEYQRRIGKRINLRNAGSGSAYLASAANTSLAAKRAARSARLAGGARMSALGGAMQGVKAAGSGSAKALLSFTAALGKTLRFILSPSGIITVIQLLILFGDKIPVLSSILGRFGQAFGDAFRAIYNIGSLMKGPMELFKAGFALLSNGQGAMGIQALKAGFSSLVSIIGNQLVAAWGRFKAALGPVYDTVRAIMSSLLISIDSIFTAIGQIIGNKGSMISSISSSLGLGDLFGSGGGLAEMAQSVGQLISLLIPKLMNWLIRLQNIFDYSGKMLGARIEYALNMANPLVSGDSAQATFEAVRSTARNEKKLADRQANDAYDAQYQAILDAFNKSASVEGTIAANAANARANVANQEALGLAKAFRSQLNTAVKQLTGGSNGNRTIQPQDARAQMAAQMQARAAQLAAMRMPVKALVGSAQQTRGNLLQSVSKIEKQQLDALLGIKENQEIMMRNQGTILSVN